jgi:hypothetical protein
MKIDKHYLSNKNTELRNKIDLVSKIIETMKNKLDKVKNILEIYYNLSKYIINNYCSTKVNYYILKI